MERLNQAGAEGYQLISATGSYPIFAIAKLDQIQHEYAWFETTSRFFFRKNDFEEKYAKLSKQGFSMADHLFIGKFCDSDPPVSYNEHGAVFDDRPENCNDIDLYLVERLKNIESPKQYRVARHSPSWKARTSDASLTEQLNDYFAAGFSPTQAFSRFEILLQQVTDEEKLAVGKLEWQVVTSPSLGNDELRKKVNEGAQQGYRLNLTQNGVAVLSRFRDSISPTTYVWLDVTKKTFLAELAQLQSKGAIYQMTYPLADGDEYVLIFELPVVNAGKLREYKTLKFELKTVENAAEKKMDINLTPSSKEAIKTLNSLANEGFEVRDLFVSDKVGTSTVNVLFERVR